MERFDVLFGGWMLVIWVLALLAVVPFIVKLFRMRSGAGPRDVGASGIELDTTDTGARLLKTRYERGEISREELEKRLE